MARTVSLTSPSSETPKETRNPSPASLSVKQATNVCQGYLTELNRAAGYHEDNPAARASITETVKELIAQETQVGNADQFHNFAVALGSGGFDALACDVLDCALQRFPMNVDLLADYLIYGIDCERFEECAKHFRTLEMIGQDDWTWRCFAFSIVYFNRLRDNLARTPEERKAYREKAGELAQAYQKYLPYEEGGYRESAKLLQKDPDAMLKVLNEALANEVIGSCPTCAFEKAEILFGRKKYAEALDAINRSLEDSFNQTQGGVNENYLHFLRGLCEYALLLQKTRSGNAVDESTVLRIYADFNLSLRELDGNYREKVKTRTENLVEETEIPVPDNMDRLLELIE